MCKKSSLIISLVLSVFMLFMIAGCAGKTDSSSQKQQNSTSAEGTVSEKVQQKVDPFAERLEISFATFNPIDNKKSKIYSYISKKYNIDIEMIQIGWDNYMEKTKLWLASGDAPDMMWGDLSFSDISTFAKSGSIMKIPSFDKYPNLTAMSNRYENFFNGIKINGHLYFIPHMKEASAEYNKKNLNVHYVTYIRRDWAEKLGVKKDFVDTMTLDEFESLAKKFVEQDPGGNGRGKTLGYARANGSLSNILGYFNPEMAATGYIKKEGKYIWTRSLPGTLDGIKYCKKLYDEGILPIDFYTYKVDDADKLFYSGKLGMLGQGPTPAHFDQHFKAFADANPGLDPLKVIGLMVITNNNGRGLYSSEKSNYWTSTIFSSKISDAKMERMLSLLDWGFSDEGTKFKVLGVPGEDWNEENGKINLKWSKDGSGNLISPYAEDPQLGPFIQHLLCVCASEDLDLLNPAVKNEYKDAWKKIMSIYGEKLDYYTPTDYKVSFFNAPNIDRYGSFSKDINDQINKLIVESKDIDKDWNSYLKTMEEKVNLVLTEINENLK